MIEFTHKNYFLITLKNFMLICNRLQATKLFNLIFQSKLYSSILKI